jgi:putative tRNA adenosine deaminase-associated protein
VSYFTAVLAREGSKWFAHDVDLESMGDLDELADELRDVATEDEPVLVLVEREDAWWAVLRVDGEEDPRVFVSDVAGVAASPYAELLNVAPEEEDEAIEQVGCAGDFDVLADLGTSPEKLTQMCEDEMLPMDALAAVSEAGGFAEVLDSLR